MPKFLEKKLKEEYGADSKVPYKVMNKMGAMKGGKETPKGRAMEKKHMADMGKKKASSRQHGKKMSRDDRDKKMLMGAKA